MKIKCHICNSSLVFQKFVSNKFRIFFCKECSNGFTYPVPKNIGRYYNNSYWLPKGFIGILKKNVYRFFQLRRKYWIMNYLKKGTILDVGAGEAIFSGFFNEAFKVTSIDLPSASIQNLDVIKTDFLTWKPGKKFDAIVFWESLEHTAAPGAYIQKAAGLLNSGGYLFIEYPRANSLESYLFRSNWYHLDPPRHLSHLTPKGLGKILAIAKFTKVSHAGVPAFEYTIAGFTASTLNLFKLRPDDFFNNPRHSIFLLSLIPVIIISTFVEVFFFIIGQSPIYLTVAKK